MLLFKDLKRINSSRLNRLNYGPHTASALPPFRIHWQFRDGKEPALVKESHGAGWTIVGWTNNPPFQHDHRPGPPDIAILFEHLDGDTAWWHFVDPNEYSASQEELAAVARKANPLNLPRTRPKTEETPAAEEQIEETIIEPQQIDAQKDNGDVDQDDWTNDGPYIPFEERIDGVPDEEIVLQVPLKLVMSPRYTQGVLTFFTGGAEVFDDDGETKIGHIHGGINGAPYFSLRGTGETWKIPIQDMWDAFTEAMEKRKQANDPDQSQEPKATTEG
jgi:hypothetical protein